MGKDGEPKKNQAAVSLGRRGGKVTSDAKRRAAVENGKHGGRPRKPPESPPAQA